MTQLCELCRKLAMYTVNGLCEECCNRLAEAEQRPDLLNYGNDDDGSEDAWRFRQQQFAAESDRAACREN